MSITKLTHAMANYLRDHGVHTYPSTYYNTIEYQFHLRFLDIHINGNEVHIIHHFNHHTDRRQELYIHLADPTALDQILQAAIKAQNNQPLC